MTTEGWPDDRLTSSDVPSLVRHHAGPVEDPDRYELLGEAEGADEAWHVLDHRAQAGEALFTLAALRPRAVEDLEVRHAPDRDEDGAEAVSEEVSPEELWRERAAGLARVRHARLAGSSTPSPAPRRTRRAGVHRRGRLELRRPGAGRGPVRRRLAARRPRSRCRGAVHRPGHRRQRPVRAAPRLRGRPAARPRRHHPALGPPRRLLARRRGPPRRRQPRRSAARSAAAVPAHRLHGPEVRAGALPSAASDVFGFGATALFVLTGTAPATSPDGVVDPPWSAGSSAPPRSPRPTRAWPTCCCRRCPRTRRNGPTGCRRGSTACGPSSNPAPPSTPTTGSPRRRSSCPSPRGGDAVAAKRPVVVVVGALLLATAGTAVAITAVQQGKLRDVPNPVAIVQPPQESSTLPTSSVPQPATTAGDAAPSTGPAVAWRRRAGPSTRRSTSAGNPRAEPRRRSRRRCRRASPASPRPSGRPPPRVRARPPGDPAGDGTHVEPPDDEPAHDGAADDDSTDDAAHDQPADDDPPTIRPPTRTPPW